MFPRKKKNRTGTISVVVVDKSRGGFKEIKSFGVAKTEEEADRYYNHSTWNDLIITGLCGLRPRQDNTIEVNPLLPQNKWDYFCLDNVLYHGHNLTILWDKDGSRYHAGKGLRVYVDGKLAGHRDTLGRLIL